jgi:carbon monoxide dehydrogenase subunit G
MKLSNEMVVPAPLDEAWAVMLDVERVAPCLPGASVEAAGEDEYRGTMKVKLGPITSSFEGTLRVEEADEAAHRAVLSARAREARGQGTAMATITSTMAPVDQGTRVTVETDLRVTGPAASFGRGVMQDVSAKLMAQFADCLAAQMGRGEAAPAAPAAAEAPAEAGEDPDRRATVILSGPLPDDVPEPPPTEAGVRWPAGASAPAATPPDEAPRPVPHEDVLDLGAVGGQALAKRAAPLAGLALVLLLLVALLRRRGKR